MRIGILGGSFDPVHNGHLAIAKYASSELNLDQVIFVPTSANPLKKKSCVLTNQGRLTLLREALKNFENFSVSDCELRRPGPSYTVETLRYFRKKFGPKTQLYFLSGADTPRHFSRWKSPKKVLKLCRFVVMTRPGNAFKMRDTRFLWLSMPPENISSSEIREKIKRNKGIRDLLPSGLERTLKRNLSSVE